MNDTETLKLLSETKKNWIGYEGILPKADFFFCEGLKYGLEQSKAEGFITHILYRGPNAKEAKIALPYVPRVNDIIELEYDYEVKVLEVSYSIGRKEFICLVEVA